MLYMTTSRGHCHDKKTDKAATPKLQPKIRIWKQSEPEAAYQVDVAPHYWTTAVGSEPYGAVMPRLRRL